MPPRLIDTNILLRYLTRDDLQKAQAALNLLVNIEQGLERAATSPLVIFETVFTLQRGYRVPRQQIRSLLLPIIRLRGLLLPDKPLYEDALDLYAASPLSFADAFNVVYMRRHGLDEIYSWDTDFDHLPGTQRVEPT